VGIKDGYSLKVAVLLFSAIGSSDQLRHLTKISEAIAFMSNVDLLKLACLDLFAVGLHICIYVPFVLAIYWLSYYNIFRVHICSYTVGDYYVIYMCSESTVDGDEPMAMTKIYIYVGSLHYNGLILLLLIFLA